MKQGDKDKTADLRPWVCRYVVVSSRESPVITKYIFHLLGFAAHVKVEKTKMSSYAMIINQSYNFPAVGRGWMGV